VEQPLDDAVPPGVRQMTTVGLVGVEGNTDSARRDASVLEDESE
jgi:hypothetical protein